MMQTFRNNMKIIFYVLIFFFVGWMAVTLTGLDEYLAQRNQDEIRGMQYAGTVDGRQISRATFEQRVQRRVDMITSQRQGATLSAWEIDQVADQVWSEMINEVVLAKVLDRHGIKVTNSEVIEYVKTNPLPELMREPSLQTDGRFDYDKYLALLTNPQAAGLVLELERDAREKIPNFELYMEIASLQKLTDAELERAYKAMDERAQVSFIHFPTDSLVADDRVSVTDEEVQAYYQEHAQEFERPEMAAMEYLLIPLTAGSQDSAATMDTLRMVREKLAQGANWDTLSLQYSEGPLASVGGNLGWIKQGDLADQELVELALSLKAGELAGPTLTTMGCQLVRVDSVKTLDGDKLVKASHILRQIQPGPRRAMDMQRQARALRNLMRDGGEGAFTRVAADSGYQVMQTPSFPIGSQIPAPFAGNRELLDFLYGSKQGELSYPIQVSTFDAAAPGSSAILVARITDRKSSGQVPLAEAGEFIRRKLMVEKKRSLAGELIAGMMGDYAGYPNLEAFAVAKGLILQSPAEFSRMAGLPEVGRNNAFIGTAFGLPVGARSQLVEVDDDFYLLQVNSRTEPDMQRFQQNRAQIAEQVRSQQMQTMFSLFTQELIGGTKIEDLRRPPAQDSVNQTATSGN